MQPHKYLDRHTFAGVTYLPRPPSQKSKVWSKWSQEAFTTGWVLIELHFVLNHVPCSWIKYHRKVRKWKLWVVKLNLGICAGGGGGRVEMVLKKSLKLFSSKRYSAKLSPEQNSLPQHSTLSLLSWWKNLFFSAWSALFWDEKSE